MEINVKLLNKVAQYMVDNHVRMALAESMTAGYFCTVWSLQVDSSHYFKGGVVAFDREVKEGALQVPADLIDSYTAESLHVTESMVEGLSKLIDADLYIGVTGMAYEGEHDHPFVKQGDVFMVVRYKKKTSYFPIHSEQKLASGVFIEAFNVLLVKLAKLFHLSI